VEPKNDRARTVRAWNQRTAMPVPPVQGPESQSAFYDGPGPASSRWATNRPGVPSRARSAVCDGPELRHGQT
jgi:hypothetical protein